MSQARDGPRDDNDPNLPQIAALFVVKFDQREGYKLVWSKSALDFELDGIVDFKSLPSGLHNVSEDLVYFVQGDYAGISAYVNVPGDASQRGAQMLAAGALIPITQGRHGKSWRHAEGLQDLARKHLSNAERLHQLEEYWEKNQVREGRDDRPDGPQFASMPSSASQVSGYRRRRRGISDATALKTEQKLPKHHPALSLPKFVNDFGPLIFPLYRAALLRKRLLLVGGPPVEQNCSFVYNLSILSSVPSSLLSLLPVDSIPPLRLRTLFNVGITDMASLELPRHSSSSSSSSSVDFSPSWVACTTDDVLAVKPQLYDILIKLPASAYSLPLNYPPGPGQPNPTKAIWPIVYPSSPLLSQAAPKTYMKATRRDLRRYKALRAGLSSLPSARPESDEADDASVSSSHSRSSSTSSTLSHDGKVIEATPWPLIAYNGFMWWASAGEKKDGLTADEEAELEQDRHLLEPEPSFGMAMESTDDIRGQSRDRSDQIPAEMAVVGYFHRLTALIFTAVSDAISRVDGESVRRGSNPEPMPSPEERGREGAGLGISTSKDASADEAEDEPSDDENAPLLSQHGEDDLEAPSSDQFDVQISSEDMKQMGLDVWSRADREFVEEFVQLWWGRKAVVEGGRIECCGVRVL